MRIKMTAAVIIFLATVGCSSSSDVAISPMSFQSAGVGSLPAPGVVIVNNRAFAASDDSCLHEDGCRKIEGYAFINKYNPRTERMNLLLNTNPEIPEGVWADPRFRESIGVGVDGTFPVNLYRIDDYGDAFPLKPSLRVGATGGGMMVQVSLTGKYRDQLKQGDAVFIQYTPGLLFREVAEMCDCEAFKTEKEKEASVPGNPVRTGTVPFMTVIDNTSNDPINVPGIKMVLHYRAGAGI